MQCSLNCKGDFSFHVAGLWHEGDSVWLVAKVDCSVVGVPDCCWVVLVVAFVNVLFKGMFGLLGVPVENGNW